MNASATAPAATRSAGSPPGLPVLSPVVTRRLIDRVAGSGQGRSNAEIGSVLYLSVPTVKTHVSSNLTKLDLNNRVQIALLTHDADPLDDPE
jgi:DNA-binding CsgD family transcriptional regulator